MRSKHPFLQESISILRKVEVIVIAAGSGSIARPRKTWEVVHTVNAI